MLILLAVGKTKTAPVLITVRTEEGEIAKYAITESEYSALGCPAVGDTLDGEDEARLLTMAAAHAALRAALRILAFSDNNAATLRRKLRARGHAAKASDRAVSEVIRRGYLREGDLLERAVLAAARKLWGPRRITEALVAKGYRRGEVEDTLRRLTDAGEIDFAASRRRLLTERLKDESDPQRKRAFLYRYGY